MNKIITFLKEAKSELYKVNWPNQKQIIEYTIAVLIISLVVSIFLGSLDMLFSRIVETYFLNI